MIHSASITVGKEAVNGQRIDKLLAAREELPSRSQIHLQCQAVTLNGRRVKLAHIAYPGDTLDLEYNTKWPTTCEPEPIQFSILYEDERVVVVNKPTGMVVHPGIGVSSGTLVQGLHYRYPALTEQEWENPTRAGLVHRLDKDTSGVIIAAKDLFTYSFLARQFAERRVEKTYAAIVRQSPPEREGRVNAPIARDPKNRKRFAVVEYGKEAITEYHLIRSFDGCAFLSLRPLTGRTHQLRIHLRLLGCPIVGDPLYGRRDPRFPEAKMMLHAYCLRIALLPDAQVATFRAPIPERMRTLLLRLRGQEE